MFISNLHRRGTLALVFALCLSAATVVFSSVSASARVTGTGRVHSQATVTRNGITVSPTVEFVDGIIRGNLRATSTTGRKLRYAFVGSSHGGKLDIGNVPVSEGATATDPQSFTLLPYATWLDVVVAKGTQTFTVRVSPVPGGGLTAKAALTRSVTVDIRVDLDALAPRDAPIAFTYAVASFDGVKISTNFFPASNLSAGATAGTLLEAPGLGTGGVTNPYALHGEVGHIPGPGLMRQTTGPADVAYNVVTWDSRGTHASGGTMQFGNPFFEGRDVSTLIDWVSSSTPATMNGPNDPAIGIFGASLGGATALVAAATDPRMDAVVPISSWTSLDTALNPNGVFHSSNASSILATLKESGARINANIQKGLVAGIQGGELSDETRAALASTGPSILFHQIQAPTFLIQSSSDAVNRLEDSVWNVQEILDNPYGPWLKMAWFNAKHADVTTTIATLFNYAKSWFNKFVVGIPNSVQLMPDFQWWDQHGVHHVSNLYPFSSGFNTATPTRGSSAGGSLKFSPVSKGAVKVTSLTVPITVPVGSKVAGAPVVSFDYTGRGTAKAVLVRLVNVATGAMVGSITTPVPVTLDGARHSVSVPLADIVYSVTSVKEGNLALQILSWVKPFSKHWSGKVALSNVTVDVPLVR